MGYGVITEQGDLGLGFTEASEQEMNQIRENIEKERKEANQESSNEEMFG